MLRVQFVAILIAGALVGGCNCHKTGGPNGSLQGDLGAPTFKLADAGATANTLDFGAVPVGQHVRLTLGLSNTGPGPMTVVTQAIAGPDEDGGVFVETSPFKPSLAVGSSETAIFQFSPQQAGHFTDQFALTDDGKPASAQATLTGIGVDIDVTADPDQVDFGGVQVGVTTPPTQQVVFTNNGTQDATVSVDPTGMDPAYQLTDASGQVSSANVQTLSAGGGSYAVTVSFVPAAVGNDTSNFSWTGCTTDNPPVCANPQSIVLNAVGIDAVLSAVPNPVSFIGVPGGQSQTQTVTVTNTGSNAATLTCIRLLSASSTAGQGCGAQGTGAFAVGATTPSTPSPIIVPAGVDGGTSTVFVPITYTASQNGNDQDQLLLDYTPLTTITVKTTPDPLVGDGALTPCAIKVTPPAINFGDVLHLTPLTESATIFNLGQSSCQVSNVTLDASSDSSYTLAAGQATSFSIPAGGSATVGATITLANGNPPNVRRGAIDFQTTDPFHTLEQVQLTATLNADAQYAAGWPKWHFDNNNSGQSTADTSNLQGVVAWSYAGLANAQQMNQLGTGVANCGGEAYVNSPIVADDVTNAGTYYIYQVSLDGNLYAFSQTGSVLWRTMLSDPSGDPHPSTPAATADGHIWAMSGSDATGDSLFFLDQSGAIAYHEPYGEDGFDACPGLGADGTLYEADDDGSPQVGGSDPFSAIAFAVGAGGQVNIAGGVALPLADEAERFGIAIGSDGTSYWGNNGQFFAITPLDAGFQASAAWPANGVQIGNLGSSFDTVTPILSDLALDPINTQFVYAYSSWENQGTGSVVVRPGTNPNNTTTYSVQGELAALSMATGAIQWTLNLPPISLPAGWTQLCSDSGNAAPAVARDGTVYVGNGDGLRAVDGPTGTVKWLFPSANVSGSPAIGGDGTVFFGCSDGSFYAVNADGSLRFKLALNAPVSSSPAIADDGTVFVVSDQGIIWAIK